MSAPQEQLWRPPTTVGVYYTARLRGGTIPGHARLGLRVSKPFGESTEISIVGQNLLRPRTLEYGDAFALLGTQAVRSVYGKSRGDSGRAK